MREFLYKKGMVFGIIFLFIGASIVSISASDLKITQGPKIMNYPTNNNYLPLFTFDAILELSYDESIVNNASFIPDGIPVYIPITISYKIVVPHKLLSGPFLTLKNLFLFGTFYKPVQMINLTVQNEPEWASISFVNPNPIVDVDNEFNDVETGLVICCHRNAPAQPYILSLKAEAPPIKRICRVEHDLCLVFEPAYVPHISVYSDQSNVETPPSQMTNVTINITNHGNARTLVNTRIIDRPEDWVLFLSQPQIILDINETDSMILGLIPPNDSYSTFVETILLEFTPERSPPRADDEPGTPILFSIRAHYP